MKKEWKEKASNEFSHVPREMANHNLTFEIKSTADKSIFLVHFLANVVTIFGIVAFFPFFLLFLFANSPNSFHCDRTSVENFACILIQVYVPFRDFTFPYTLERLFRHSILF